MKYLRLGLMFVLLVPISTTYARTEIALMSKGGYVVPLDRVQELNGTVRHFSAGPGYGIALEFRNLRQGDRPCGIAMGPEFLRYHYGSSYQFGARPHTGDTDSITLFFAPKVICATDKARFSLGTGIGMIDNSIPSGGLHILTSGTFYQLSAAAEFGANRLRGYTELRYLRNEDGDAYREFDGSGYGVFIGISVILRKLPPARRR